MSKRIETVYKTGKVLRYHANVELNSYPQTDADHQWGCAVLLLMLYPEVSSNLLKAALLHDAGEYWAGDVPYPFKVSDPEAAKRHSKVEKKLSIENGVPQYELTETENKWLTMVDRLECVLFCRLKRPDQLETKGWLAQDKVILEIAQELKVLQKVEEILYGRT